MNRNLLAPFLEMLSNVWMAGKTRARRSPAQPGQDFGTAETGSGGREQKKCATRDFHGTRFSNRTTRRSSSPDARLAHRSKAHAAFLGYRGHVLMDNRHHLVVDSRGRLAG